MTAILLPLLLGFVGAGLAALVAVVVCAPAAYRNGYKAGATAQREWQQLREMAGEQ